MLTINNVSYSYNRSTEAIKDASALLENGLYLLLGENGAGKTTLMHLMCGLRFPMSGKCAIDGEDVALRRTETLEKTFLLGDDFDCPFATINQMARRHGCFYPSFSFDMLKANLKDFGMTGDEKVKAMSFGMKRKAYAAYALALGVDYLLLDEPANGMDIDSKKTLRQMIARCIGDERTAVISTHNVHDLGAMFDHVMVMHKGRLRIAMPIWEITEQVSFVTSHEPVVGAIYQEPDAGRFKAIIPNEDGTETDIDYPLFYSAIMAPVGDMFIDFLNNYKREDNERGF